MKEKGSIVKKNIQKNNIKLVAVYMLLEALFCYVINFMLNKASISEIAFFYYFLAVGCVGLGIVMLVEMVKALLEIAFPSQSSVCKRYGSLEEIEKIIEDAINNKIYEDSRLLMSEYYVIDKKAYTGTIAFSEVRTIESGIIGNSLNKGAYKITINGGQTFSVVYQYPLSKEREITEAMRILKQKCPEALYRDGINYIY